MNIDILSFITGLIFTGIIVTIYYLAGISKLKDNFAFEVTPAKMCRGGAYMFQGDSKKAKFCQDFVETPEGKKDMCRYQCSGPPGLYNGYPGKKFEYTSQSDAHWNNEQCNTLGTISPLGIF
jgi:hypothetical protein